jgi:chromosome segregation ATPase
MAELEQELASLRAQMDDDSSSFASLEQQIAELRDRLAETRDGVHMHELRLAEKKAELAAAERREQLEAYGRDLESYRDARKRVGEAAAGFLAELDAYDSEVVSLRQLLDEMHEEFGAEDERVAEVERALAEESEELNGWWKAVVGAAKWRIVEPPEAEKEPAVEEPPAAEEVPAAEPTADLAKDLQERTEEKRVSRILDYFGKS